MELIGRVTADATVSTLKDDRKVVNFNIAINDYYKPRNATGPIKTTTFVSCAYWVSERVADRLIKGALVEMYGRIGVDAYTNKEGNPKATLTFHVSNMKIHAAAKAATAEEVPF